jgi:hypothetical protein
MTHFVLVEPDLRARSWVRLLALLLAVTWIGLLYMTCSYWQLVAEYQRVDDALRAWEHALVQPSMPSDKRRVL